MTCFWRVVSAAEAADIRASSELRLPEPPTASLEGKLLWTSPAAAEHYRAITPATWSTGAERIVEICVSDEHGDDPRIEEGAQCDGYPTRFVRAENLLWLNARATIEVLDAA